MLLLLVFFCLSDAMTSEDWIETSSMPETTELTTIIETSTHTKAKEAPIFRKCCALDERFDKNKNCTKLKENHYIPWIPKVLFRNLMFQELKRDSYNIIENASLSCPYDIETQTAERKYVETMNYTKGYSFFQVITGKLIANKGDQLVLPGQFCVDGEIPYANNISKQNSKDLPEIEEDIFVVKFCGREKCTEEKPCIYKCCNNGYSLSWTDRRQVGCVLNLNENQSFQPNFYTPAKYIGVSPINKPVGTYQVRPWILEWKRDETRCRNLKEALKYPDDLNTTEPYLYLMDNGELWISYFEKYRKGKFCIDRKIGEENYVTIICETTEFRYTRNGTKEGLIIITVGNSISVIFLMMTIFTYAAIPKLRNLPGKILLSYMITLLCFYFVITVLQTGIIGHNHLANVLLSFLIYYFFVASTFWLNIYSFELWKTFTSVSLSKSRGKKKFVLYSLYAFGFPMLLIMVIIIMDYTPGINPFLIKPYLGHSKWWFREYASEMVYFVIPVSVILLSNTVFFTLIIRKLIADKKIISSAQNDNKKDQTKSISFKLYAKMFIMVGVGWVLEVTANVVGSAAYHWYISDAFNSLQGLFLFIVYIHKRTTPSTNSDGDSHSSCYSKLKSNFPDLFTAARNFKNILKK